MTVFMPKCGDQALGCVGHNTHPQGDQRPVRHSSYAMWVVGNATDCASNGYFLC